MGLGLGGGGVSLQNFVAIHELLGLLKKVISNLYKILSLKVPNLKSLSHMADQNLGERPNWLYVRAFFENFDNIKSYKENMSNKCLEYLRECKI